MTKCLLLFSGGLDSILSAEILKKEKVKVFPICFKSYFFDCNLAKKSAKKLGLRLKVVDFSKTHLKIIKEPNYGYGKGMNPCIDCHLLMLKKAKEIKRKKKYDFIATGEVLGQRPFSQNKQALFEIEKKAGLNKQILRPLSAKLLPETFIGEKNLVKRENLFAIQGKSRKHQLALAKKFKIKEFPSPAGGCILCELEYSKRLKELFEKIPNCDGLDCQTLRKGRVFWNNKFLIIVGRNEKENKELKKIKKKKDIILEPKNFPGPSVLIRGFGKEIKKKTKDDTEKLLLKYSKELPKSPKIEELKAVRRR